LSDEFTIQWTQYDIPEMLLPGNISLVDVLMKEIQLYKSLK